MACVYCEDGGYWVCEPEIENPSCGFDSALPPENLIYLGRYQINQGTWSVWRRGNTVSISDCVPNPSNGGTWKLAGCLPFADDGDYDVWRTQPGNRIKIQRSQDTGCSECDD
ncbi:MAG: hypothetical protein KJO11_09505 [Gemmatimonadetes bacterium]|nr:hypothetical protein [Gemmatimonadota bacterium]NNK65054.1 hypothetical protein [Gemmatimonadota bacterium]